MIRNLFLYKNISYFNNKYYNIFYRLSSNISIIPWDIKKWTDYKIKGSSFSFELFNNTECRGRIKRLTNKEKIPKDEWIKEKEERLKISNEILNSIPNVIYNEDDSFYYFSLHYHDNVVKLLKRMGASVSSIPKSVFHVFGMKMFLSHLKPEKKYIVNHIPSNLYPLPKKLDENLFPFQKEGIDFAVKQGGRCLIGDEMGLGKTLQAIGIASMYKDDWPILIICPSSVRMSWANEIIKWLDINEDDICIILKGSQTLDGKINIISYDLISKVIAQQNHFKFVIIDESHFIKNRKAKRTISVGRITASARRVIMLSGTPALSRPEELYNQLTFLQPLLFPTFHSFAYRYCAAYRNKFGWDYSGNSHSSELYLLLKETIMIRRLKDEVLQDLPPKYRNSIYIESDKNKIIRQKMKEFTKVTKTNKLTDKRNRDLLITSLYRETCKSKIESVISYIETFIECCNDKIIIFAHHHVMLDAIQLKIEELNLQFIRIDGSVSPNARFQYVEEFQNDLECRIAIISITAGGTGITLNAASKVIFAELYWTPSLLLQAEDRAHRIGQKNHVSIYYLVARDTFDEILWSIIKKKINIVTKTLDGEIRHFKSNFEYYNTDKTSIIEEKTEKYIEELSDDLFNQIE